MSLIDLPTAKAHLRQEPDYPDAQVSIYLNAAELTASQFLNRRIFATSGHLTTAVNAVPATLVAAGTAYSTALADADAIIDEVARCAAQAYALRIYRQAHTDALETRCGIVINDLIKAGILLILGHLFENREDVIAGVSVVELPQGSRTLLMPYRIGMGV